MIRFPSALVLAAAGAAMLTSGPAARADSFPPITDAERALTEVAFHPGAPAVVLFKKAELKLMDFRKDVSSNLKVQVRIKVLSEEGKAYGEIEIPHSSFYRLTGFEGRTVLADGSVAELDKDSIFRERSSKARKSFVTKAAFPAVEAGAIIDFRYALRWDSIYFLEPWYFHNEIPTLLSEIVYDKPENMGLQPWYRQTSQQALQSDTKKTLRGIRMRVWVEDLPGLPDEPYSFPSNDLSSRFMVVPTKVVLSGQETPLFESWKEVCKDFETYFYAKARNKDRQASKKAAELVANAAGPREKAAAIYRFVRDEVLTTESAGVFIYTDSTADRTFSERRGSSTEKAILLQAMLASVKLKPRLVWTTDRSEGRADLSVPNPFWFDRVLVAIDADGGERLFLDPSNRRLGFGHVSPLQEGTEALLFDKKKPEVITLPRRPFEDNLRRAKLELTLDEEGRVTGTGSLRLAGHHALSRLRWKDGNDATTEAWKGWLTDVFEGYEADAVEVEEAIDVQEVRVKWTLAQREEEVLGDETSLRPSRPLGPLSQPFALPAEQRLTPVWFSYGDRDEVELTVTWPESWELDLTPEAADLELEVGKLATRVQIDEANRRLTFSRLFDVRGCEFDGREKYAALRDLYALVEKSDAQDLVFIRR